MTVHPAFATFVFDLRAFWNECLQGESHWLRMKASFGELVLNRSLHDRLKTLNFRRMPEGGKTTLKAQLAAKVSYESAARP